MEGFSWGQIVAGVVTAVIILVVSGYIKLPNRMTKLETDVEALKKMVQTILDIIISSKVTASKSPKQITEKGHEILNAQNIEEFLNRCPLVQNIESFKGKEELDIYLECLKWVDEHGERKMAEIMYESELSKEQCRELLALAIRDKILPQLLN